MNLVYPTLRSVLDDRICLVKGPSDSVNCLAVMIHWYIHNASAPRLFVHQLPERYPQLE